jgi:hypothetical protein
MNKKRTNRGERKMKRHIAFGLIMVIGAVPAMAAPAADTPDIFNMPWSKNVFNFETVPGHPEPPQNRVRLPNGMSDSWHLVGDWENPILTPKGAEILKQRGQVILNGGMRQNDADQCRSMGPPFSLAMGAGIQFLSEKNGDIILMMRGQPRRIHMNAQHPANLELTPKGDSIGHWDGETLVVDTVGIRSDALTTADRFGTPQSEKMHIVERYYLIDGAKAKAQADAFRAHEGAIGGQGTRDGNFIQDTRLQGLQLDAILDDPVMFKEPLHVRVTYRRGADGGEGESVCADNPMEHYEGEWKYLPKAVQLDF